MAELQVARWRRYGKDRLYVTDGAGTQVGWVDISTGMRTITNPTGRDAFDTVVDAWYASAATPVPPAPPEPATVEFRWHDLAQNKPGEAVRKRAELELAAMRARSRVGAFVARATDMKTDERAWRVGADGEETVGARLDRLTSRGWHVLHSVPIGNRGSDIDHVVIGHGGVYTINTKRHPGGKVWVGAHAIKVNGQTVPYLRNSRFEASRAERLLSQAVGFPVPVKSALVFLTGTMIPNVTIKQTPADVLIYDRMDIPGVFKRAPRRVDPEQIAVIFDQARRCTTWTGSTRCTCAE